MQSVNLLLLEVGQRTRIAFYVNTEFDTGQGKDVLFLMESRPFAPMDGDWTLYLQRQPI